MRDRIGHGIASRGGEGPEPRLEFIAQRLSNLGRKGLTTLSLTPLRDDRPFAEHHEFTVLGDLLRAIPFSASAAPVEPPREVLTSRAAERVDALICREGLEEQSELLLELRQM